MQKRSKNKRIFSRPKNQKDALLKSLATALFLHGKITTTQAKAKELRIVAEKCITRARDNSLANRRILGSRFAPAVTKKLIDEIAPKYANRPGGYTRMVNLGPRKTDGAKMAIIELVK